MSEPPPAHSFDVSVPVLLFKVSKYPLSHGTLGAVRSLGRVGVPVHALIEGRFIPYAFSRYIKSTFLFNPEDARRRATLVSKLIDICQKLGKRTVLIATDDEAALLVSEHSAELRSHFLIHENDPTLLLALSSKHGLDRLCRQHGIPTPRAAYAKTLTQVTRLSDKLHYPIVVKNSDPWTRLSKAAVGATTIVASRSDLLAMAEKWPENPCVVFQEYIPAEVAEDWIFHAYCNRESEPLLAFTGLKERSWPPGAGVTASAISLPNEQLRQSATTFLRAIGYRGIVDMDWRYDGRDGQYKLVDFNPRVGANFRLFSNSERIDVVRALHLDLTGCKVPSAPEQFGRRFLVENLDIASRFVRQPYKERLPSQPPSRTELAWFAIDDPLPFFIMVTRFAKIVMGRIANYLFQSRGAAKAAQAQSPHSTKTST